MSENLLDRVFKISQYIKDDEFDVQNQEFRRDPWTMDPLSELYISSEKLNSQVAHLVQIISAGNSINSIRGDIKSGKSYLMNLLNEGMKESLWKYADFDKIHILLFNEEDFKEYTFTKYVQKISENVLNKFFPTKELNTYELQNYVKKTNSLIVVLLDDFTGDKLHSISSDTAKIHKSLKGNFSSLISFNVNDMPLSLSGLKEKGWDHFTYSIRIPELSLIEAKEVIRSRMCYALNKASFRVTEVFSENAIDRAWSTAKGNPWILISILSNAYDYSLKKGSKTVRDVDVSEVIGLFSPSTVQDGLEDHDKFMIQQALNNFPYSERQVCEYLMHKDATAKDITIHLYGELPSSEYRSKYMGTKSFLKRLKDKNVVVVAGEKGRSLLFGLNPKMKERLTQVTSRSQQKVSDEQETIAF
ncbi:MAG: hypothetical protein ACTSQF_16035 [Candidatus Heimdallarchaeaceae archaeon]